MSPRILFLAATSGHEKLLQDRTKYRIVFFKLQQKLRRNIKQEHLLAFLEQAERLAEEEDIDALYTSSDLGSLFLGILCDRLGYRGPNFESVFRCYHKYYTRLYTHAPVRFASLNTEKPLQAQELMPFPFYLKAPQSSFGVLGYTIDSFAQLQKLWPLLCREIRQMNKPLLPLYEQYLDRELYPLAFEHALMMEQVIRAPQITVEGYVRNHVFHPVMIIDTNFDADRLIDNFSIPTTLSPQEQKAVFAQAQEDLSSVGLNDSFCNIEYWITNEGPKLIEINARSAATFRWMYQQSAGLDIFEAGFKLALGKAPKLHPTVTRAAAQCNIITKKEGLASDLLDFDALKQYPYRYSLAVRRDTQVRQLSEHGAVLAQIEIAGSTYQEIKRRADEVRSKVRKEPSAEETT